MNIMIGSEEFGYTPKKPDNALIINSHLKHYPAYDITRAFTDFDEHGLRKHVDITPNRFPTSDYDVNYSIHPSKAPAGPNKPNIPNLSATTSHQIFVYLS